MQKFSTILKKGKTIEVGISKCNYCTIQQNAIEECCKIHKINLNGVKAVTKHIWTCEDCKLRLTLIADHTKHLHRDE